MPREVARRAGAEMKNRSQWCAFLLPWVLANVGCGGDDTTATADGGSRDAETEAEAGATPEHVLVTVNYEKTSELVAVNVETKKVDGRLTFPGFIGLTDAHSTLFPFLLEQSNDLVARLDPVRPWVIDSSWNVALKDEIDGGAAYSDPDAVVVGTENKAYVLRYTRNDIAVIDTAERVDAGKPSGTIDLASLLQKKDTDGTVEMAAGVYVAAKKRLYVLLENIDRNLVNGEGELLCSDTLSTIVAISTTDDTLVNLGTGPGGSIALTGFDPVSVVYDSENDRLLISEAGCNAAPASDAGPDAGAGPVSKRGVEAVNLADGSTKVLLDASENGFPSGFVYVNKNQAVLGFDFTGKEVYQWDPTKSKLGSLIPHAPDTFTSDDKGNLLGTIAVGSSTSVVSVAIATGKSTTLDSDPFTKSGFFVGGVDVWPHP
jgi:hypothetical protein